MELHFAVHPDDAHGSSGRVRGGKLGIARTCCRCLLRFKRSLLSDAGDLLKQGVKKCACGDASEADGGIGILYGIEIELFNDRCAVFGLCNIRKLIALPACSLGEHIAASGDIFLDIGFFEPLLNLGFCLRGLDKAQPVDIGLACRRGNDGDDIVGLELVIELDHTVPDERMMDVVADIGMDAVCKIDGRTADGKVDDIPLRGKGKDVVREEILPHVRNIFLG